MAKRKKPTVAKGASGYGNPPKHTRFKKGRSGNPNGRPKGSKNLATLLVESVNERVTINENGTPRTLSKLAVMHKQLANKGVTGDMRATQIILQKLEELESRSLANAKRDAFCDADYEVMKEFSARLRRIEKESGDDKSDKK